MALTGGLLTTSSVGGTTLNDNNDVTSFNATNTSSGDIDLTNSNVFAIAGISQSGGNLNIDNNLQAVSQTGAISVSGNTDITTGGGSPINLLTNGGSNDFTGTVALSGSTLSINNNAALELDNISAAQGLTVTANGAITQDSAGIGVGTTSSFSAGAHVINLLTSSNNNFTGAVALSNSGTNAVSINNAINLILASSSVGQNLTVNANGSITQTGTLTVPGTSSFTAGANAIDLSTNGSSNTFTGAVTLSNSGAHNVALTDSTALSLASVGVGSGTLQLSGVGISQTGAITEAANAGSVTINGNAGVINLSNTSNNFTGTVSLNNSGNNAVTLNNTGTILTLGASTVGSATTNVTNTGALTLSGTYASSDGAVNFTTLSPDTNARNLTINGNITTSGGAIDLTAANNSGGTATALIVNNPLNTTPGTGGVLTLSGGLALNATPTVGSGSVTLQGNGLDLSLGTVSFSSATSFAVNRFITITGALNSTNGTNLVLQGDRLNSGTGGVYVASGGSISSSGSLTLEGSNLSGLSGADSSSGIDIASGSSISAATTISLVENTGNSNIDVNGNVTTSSANAINITPAGTGVINLGAQVSSAGGAINFNAPTVLDAASIVNAGNAPITFAQSVTGGQSLTLQNNTSANGTVTFDSNVSLGTLVTFAQPYQVIIDGSGTASTLSNLVTFNNTGGVTLGNNSSNVFNFTSGLNSSANTTTTFDSTINTTNSGISLLGSTVLGGNSSFSTGSGAISFAGITGAKSLSLTTSNGTTFNNTVNIGSLTTSGGGTDVIDTSAITTANNQQLGNAISLGANTTLTSTSGGVTITGTINGAHTLNLLSSTGITLQGVIGGTTPLSSLTLGDGSTDTLSANTTTSGTQTYNNPVSIGANIVLTSTAGAIDFTSTVDGAKTLTLSTVSGTTFNGIVGGGTPLAGLTLGGGGTDTINTTNINSSGTQNYNDNVSLTGTTALTATAGDVNIAGNLNGNTNALTLNDSGSGGTISGILSGLTSLTIGGTGSEALANANTYSGNTTVNNGATLFLANNNALGNGSAIVLTGGTLGFSGVTLNVGSNITLDTGSTLLESNAFGANTLSGNVSLNGTDAINVSNAFSDQLTLSGILSGSSVTINKGGVGTLVLDGANTFTGSTNVNTGTLTVGSNAGLGASSATATVASNATLALSGTSLNIPNNLTLNNNATLLENNANGANTLSGNIGLNGTDTVNVSNATNDVLTFSGILSGTTVTFDKIGVGTLILSGVNTFTGTTNINAGVINAENNAALGATSATVTIATNAALDLTGSTLSIANAMTLNGTGISNTGVIVDTSSGGNNTLSGALTLGSNVDLAVNNSNDTLTLSGLINDNSNNFSITKLGAGTLALSHANTYGGGTVVNAGILEALNNAALGSAAASVTSGAELAINGSSLNIGNALTLNGTGISNAGALADISSGGNNTISGTVTLGSNAVVGVTASGDALTLSNAIGDGGSNFSLTKVGLGTLTLSHANTFGGGTNINAGVLAAGNNSALGTGSAVINSSGTLQINNGITISKALTLNGTGASGTEGALVGTGTSTENGAITLGANSAIGTINSGDIFTISNTINGGNTLTLQGPGTITLSNTIGNSTPLSSITSNANLNIGAGTVTTTGTQVYNDPVILTANDVFNTTNNLIEFANVDRDATAARTLTLNPGSGAITLTGNIGSGSNGALGAISLNSTGTTTIGGTVNAASLNIASGGITQINGTNITTTGNQSYGENVTFGASPTLKSGSGAITFSGVASGIGQTLTLQDASGDTGAVTFDGNVTLQNLITFGGSSNYAVTLLGSNNTFSNAVTFNNTNGVNLGNGTSNVFSFNGGLTSTASTTTLASTVNTNGNTLDLGTTTVSGNSTLNSAGGALTIGTTNSNASGTNNLTLTAGAGILSMGVIGGTNPLNNLTASTTGASNNITVANNITATAISLSAGGALSETNSAVLSGGLTTSSSTGTTLNNANTVSSFNATNTTNGNVSLTNTGALSITGISQSVGNLTIANTGAITQTAPITVSGTSSFSAGANAITLTQTNAFTGAVSLSNSGTNNVSVTNGSALQIGTSSIGQNLSLTASGSISETGVITASGGTTTVAVTAANSDILLGSQANNFGTNALVFGGTLADIRDVALRNVNAGAVLPSFTGLSNLRNLTLEFDNAAIAFPAVALTNGGNLSAIAGGAITQTGTITVPGTASFNAGGNAINLSTNGSSNSFTGAVTLDNTGANNVSLNDNIALILALSSIGQNLNITANGSITQTGTLTVSGTASFNAGANAIDLSTNGGSNSFTGAVTLLNSGTNNVTLNNNRALILAASTVGQNLNITANGAITQTGTLTVPGTASFNAGANAIDLSTNGGSNSFTGAVTLLNSGTNNVTLNDNRALILAASTVGQNLNITANGAITQNGILTVPGTSSFNAGANAITLTQTNAFTGAVALLNSGTNNVSLTNGIALQIGTSSIGQNLSLTAGGSISETGVITASGGTTTVAVTNPSSDILLGSQANNFGTSALVFGGTLADIRDVALRNVNAGAVLPSFTGLSNLRNLTLEFDNAAIAFPAVTLTNGGNLGAIAGGAITQTGAITVPGTASFNAGGNAINLVTNGTNNGFTGAVTLKTLALIMFH